MAVVPTQATTSPELSLDLGPLSYRSIAYPNDPLMQRILDELYAQIWKNYQIGNIDACRAAQTALKRAMPRIKCGKSDLRWWALEDGQYEYRRIIEGECLSDDDSDKAIFYVESVPVEFRMRLLLSIIGACWGSYLKAWAIKEACVIRYATETTDSNWDHYLGGLDHVRIAQAVIFEMQPLKRSFILGLLRSSGDPAKAAWAVQVEHG